MTKNYEKHETEEEKDKKQEDLGSQIIKKAFGTSDSKALMALLYTQDTPEQRKNLTSLFDSRLTTDKEK